MAKSFDPDLPFRTKNGHEVVRFRFKNKIMGIVIYDEDEGVFAVWDLNGKKMNLFPRSAKDSHDLDLENIE